MLLDRLGRELDLSDLEELALESERFTIQQPANDLKRLIGAAASLTEWNVEAFEFLDRVTDADTQFETSARNRVDHRDILGEANWVMKRHQQHTQRYADALGACRDRCGRRQHRGQVTVVDEAMLTQPDVVEAVLTPCDLVEDFAVEAVVRLTLLRSVAEVVPETEPNFPLAQWRLPVSRAS